MLGFCPVSRALVLCLVAIGGAAPVSAADQPRPEIAPQVGLNREMMRDLEVKAATDELLRPQVASPLMAAQQLMQDQKMELAAEKIAATDRVGNKSGYEKHVIARVRTALALQMGDAPQAARQFELAEAGRWWPTPEKASSALSIAGLYYSAKDYPQAATWYARSTELTGPDSATDMLRAQSLYLAADFANAAKLLETLVQSSVTNNQAPSEISLKILADARAKTGDEAGFQRAADLLQRFYPPKAQ